MVLCGCLELLFDVEMCVCTCVVSVCTCVGTCLVYA